MEKETIQNTAILKLKELNRVILTWATGVGKGYTTVKAIDTLKPTKTIIFVAESAHKKNWENEFKNLNVPFNNIIIECYASLKKYKNTNWDLIVFDEAHHLNSEKRIAILETLKTNKILALSATLNTDIIDILSRIFGNFYHFNIEIQKAIDNNYIPQPIIYLIPLTLNGISPTEEIVETWGKTTLRKIFKCEYKDRFKYLFAKTRYPNVELHISCTALQKYNYLTDKIEYWKNRYFACGREVVKNKWLQLGTIRKRYLGELKTKEVKSLLNRLKDKRLICFCTSIEQAQLLGANYVINSKNSKTENQKLIDNFNSGTNNKLFAIGMLQEGQNLSNIEIGIIVQLDGKERQFIQKLGRVLRSTNPVQYIFYYRGTKDEEYLKNVTENIDNRFIKQYEES